MPKKQQNVAAWHNHKCDQNSEIMYKQACPKIFFESLSPSCVIEFIFSGTTAIFQNLIYFFPLYPSQEIAPMLYLAPSWKISLCFAELCFLDSLWPQISQINFRSSWKYLRRIFSKLLDTTFYWQLSWVNKSHIALPGNDWSEHEIILTGWINPCQYNFSELLNSMERQKCLCPDSHC